MSQCYPAGVFYDLWFKLPSSFENLPTPGFESHRPLGGCLTLCWPPNRGVEAVDSDVLHHLWAQQVQEVQLDATSTEDRLLKQAEEALVNRGSSFKILCWDDVARVTIMGWNLGCCHWFEASLSSSSKVAGHLYGIWRAAQVRVDPVSAWTYQTRN